MKKKEIILNKSHNELGLKLSEEAWDYLEACGIPRDYTYPVSLRRNKQVIKCVKALGEKANDYHCNIVVQEIDPRYGFSIIDNDGYETLQFLPKKETVVSLAKAGKVEELVEYLSKVTHFA